MDSTMTVTIIMDMSFSLIILQNSYKFNHIEYNIENIISQQS